MKKLSPNNRNLVLWLMIAAVVFAFIQMWNSPTHTKIPDQRIPFSKFMQEVNANNIESVEFKGSQDIFGRTKTGQHFVTYAPFYHPKVYELLEAKGVEYSLSPPEESFPLGHLLLSWLPLLLLIGLLVFSLRQIQSGGNKAMGFGRSKAKMRDERGIKITFEDVAGVDEAKQELQEVVDFLKDPRKFQRLGGQIPKGVLLVGPPGTGKTLLARAIAGEAGVPFFNISGSDFVEMFVGVGASRVRDMFEKAKQNAPCIVFIDEIDAVGRQRGFGLGGGNDEREQTLNQLLVEMDGFEENEGVIIIAATNRPDVLDPALLRPGRFDRRTVVPNPDLAGREKIFLVHVRKVPLAPSVDIKILARGTPGFSGADLKNLVNEAALLAARKGKLAVTMLEFEQAKDKVLMGAERRTLMSDQEKKLTAYHEAGHAIVSYYVEGSYPIHKATIIPRGNALGMVIHLPEKDETGFTRTQLLAHIKVAMGGRIAEELIFGYDEVTTGAAEDIRSASNIARRMVVEWGMSDKLGFQSYGDSQRERFAGETKIFSEETNKVIDAEVGNILSTCYEDTYKMLKEKNKALHVLAQMLIEYETLTGTEIRDLLEEGNLPKNNLEEEAMPRATVPISIDDREEVKPSTLGEPA